MITVLGNSGEKQSDLIDHTPEVDMIEDHEEDIKMFEQMAKEGTNQDLKNYAEQSLSTLREHLRMARDIERKIEG